MLKLHHRKIFVLQTIMLFIPGFRPGDEKAAVELLVQTNILLNSEFVRR